MKKVVITSVVIAMVVGLGLTFAGPKGNRAPSGPHYTLNIIGVSKEKSPNMDGGGHVIFVPLKNDDMEAENGTKIWLTQGDFAVLDKNGTDQDGATFQLPNPDPENDGITAYSVYVRGLGKPVGKAKITPGFVDEDDVEWYSVESVTVERNKKGVGKFVNVSRELLYVYVDMDDNGTPERYPLFCNELWDFFWAYNNDNLKVCQLRFYEIPTDINE